MKKIFISLQVADFKMYPVWELLLDDDAEEVSVVPVEKLPVTSLDGRVVGTQFRLANEQLVWAAVSNLSTKDPQLNAHLMVARIERDGNWFNLDRYWDVTYPQWGPQALSKFLGLSIEEIFPISYDLTSYAIGNQEALIGRIYSEPRERLSDKEILGLVRRAARPEEPSQ
jgi:hypothetical protein